METNHLSNNPAGDNPPPICVGSDCDYAIDHLGSGMGMCISGSGTCLTCHLLEAEPSKFHDHHLIEATQKINHILSAIPEDPEGGKLAFLTTNKGVLLARVHHGKEVPANAVTAKSDAATLAQALKLKN